MKKSEILISVTLDEQNIPESIQWQAETQEEMQAVKAFTLALWDNGKQGTLKIDLWTKEMEVYEMKRFFIETIAGMADTIRNATQDDVMAMEMDTLCRDLSARLEKELRQK
jgi:gliding motility-associated protein GldC